MLEMDSKMARPRIVNAAPSTDTGISVALPNVECHRLNYQLFESAPIIDFSVNNGYTGLKKESGLTQAGSQERL